MRKRRQPARGRSVRRWRMKKSTTKKSVPPTPSAKPTMSAHFGVLRQAGLVDASKKGTTITYRLKMSVLEDALLGFAESFGLEREIARKIHVNGKAIEKCATNT